MSQSNQPPFDDLPSLNPTNHISESEESIEDPQAIQTNPQAIQPKRNSVVKSGDGINQTRSKLANGLLGLSIGISVGIAVLVTVDLGISKFIVWRLIEKLSEAPVSSPQTGISAAASPVPSSPNSPDKSSDATQKLIVYKDLFKEASLNKELLTLLLTSQTALVSGALGFYFGGKDNN
jgi:hypothetical protein